MLLILSYGKPDHNAAFGNEELSTAADYEVSDPRFFKGIIMSQKSP
jgi:hypothetical protein